MKGAIRTYLISLQSVFSLIGERVYSAPIPQKVTYPCISISRISVNPYHNNSGLVGTTDETWQIDCWAETDYEAEEVKEAVRRGLDAYAGVMGDFTVYSTKLESTRDLVDIEGDASENSIHRKSMDFQIVRSEATENREQVVVYIVSDAGTDAVNGRYCKQGTYNDKTYYYDQSGYYIYYNGVNAWIIGSNFIVLEALYTVLSTDNTPPLTGWNTSPLGGAEDPAPTLSIE